MRRSVESRRVILVGAVLLVTACEASSPPATRSDSSATDATTASLLPTSPSSLPSFDFSSYERLLSELRGTPVVVNLWASWCGPCQKEAAALEEAAHTHGKDIQFLGVDVKDQHGAATEFLTNYHVSYPNVFDESGDIHNSLGFVGLPDTVFYGADGSIVETWSGPLTPEVLK